MEKKSSKGKIIALICSLVVVVGLTTTGIVLAATGALSGLFASDKEKAFELLAQAPEKMSESALNEQLGTKELYKAMCEKGMNFGYKMTDINLQEESVNLSGMTMDMGLQLDPNNKKAGAKLTVGMNGSNVSAEGYASLDEKKLSFSLPELVKNKKFTFTASDATSQETLDDVAAVLAMLPELQESLESFLDEQGEALYDNIECNKINGGYQIKIPKTALDQLLNEFKNYVNSQSEVIGKMEEKLGVSKGTVSAGLSLLIPQITAYTQDYAFDVYENDGELSGISASIKIEEIDLKVQATFSENENQNYTNIQIDVMQNGTSAGKVTYVMDSKKGDLCEDIMKIAVNVSGTEMASCEMKQTLDVKNNNALTLSVSANTQGTEVMSMNASGSVKNLERGKCVTFKLDEISMEQSGTYTDSQKMTGGMEYTMAVLDGEPKEPDGEEVTLTPETVDSVMQTYASEMQNNLLTIVSKWDLSGMITDPSLDSSSLTPEDDSYDSGSSDNGLLDGLDSENSYDDTF